jgi:hypothetical protein
MGDYSKEEYVRRRDSRLEEVSRKEEEIGSLEMALNNQLSVEEKVERIKSFQSTWALADIEPKEKNRLLRQIIDTIFYKRLGDDIEVVVRFL